MSYLEKLLRGSKVEWKTLGEVTLTTSNIKWRDNDNIYRYIDLTSVSRDTNLITVTSEINFKSAPSRAQKIVLKNDVIFATTRPTQQRLSLIGDEYAGQIASTGYCVLRAKTEEVLPKWIFFHLTSTNFNNYVKENQSGSAYPAISDAKVKGYSIPIPPIEVQKEIVRILDDLIDHSTELLANLTAELTNRRQQYDYYREQLFNFKNEKVQHLPLGDKNIGEFQRGKRFVKDDMVSKGIPCIHYGEMYTHYGVWANESKSFLSEELVRNKNLRIAEKGDVVIVAAGETIEDIGRGTAWLGSEGVVIHDACFSYKTTLNPTYLAYFTRTKQFHDQIKKYISSGKISAINSNGLSKVLIPIPSLEEQDQIVGILDKFDSLTLSISEAIPVEIALRKKQYEYYLNILLTFHQI